MRKVNYLLSLFHILVSTVLHMRKVKHTWNVAELVCEKNNGYVVGHLVSSSKSEENVREVATTHLIWDKEFFI
jgi:hypothetical protein